MCDGDLVTSVQHHATSTYYIQRHAYQTGRRSLAYELLILLQSRITPDLDPLRLIQVCKELITQLQQEATNGT